MKSLFIERKQKMRRRKNKQLKEKAAMPWGKNVHCWHVARKWSHVRLINTPFLISKNFRNFFNTINLLSILIYRCSILNCNWTNIVFRVTHNQYKTHTETYKLRSVCPMIEFIETKICLLVLNFFEKILFLTPSPGGLFVRSAASVTAVCWNPFSSVLASVDRAKNCTIWSDA